jgi:hypothetical protein
MFHFNSRRFMALALGFLPAYVRADQVQLAGDGRLSGTVRSINDEGVVELESPLAGEPILLRGEAVRKVTFSELADQGKIPSSRLELANGDILPVEIESLDEKELKVISPVAGKLQIPRDSLKSLLLGIHPNVPIYQGPAALEEFKSDAQHGDDWTCEDGILSIGGQGRIGKKLQPLKQFIVRFTLEWHNNPSFQFYFADPLLPAHQPADRYYFQFTPAGTEIKRESTKGKRYTPFVTLDRRPDQYAGNRLQVEIRFDREQSLLYLFLNGEPEGRYIDPVAGATDAGGIAFVSNAGNETETSISEIEVLQWDHNGDRHRTEDRGDPKADSLIGKRGDRFGGKLLAIRPGGEGPIFSFKSDFQDSPIELPESEVSTIFFQQPTNPSKDGAKPFALRLKGDGVLQVSACSFPGDRIEVTHPLLGKLAFARDGVTSLERRDGKGEEP